MAMASRHSVDPGIGKKYAYPSRFGSHASMVVREPGEDSSDLQADQVVCRDEYGDYVTWRSHLDNGLADPVRHAQSRLEKLFAGRHEKS